MKKRITALVIALAGTLIITSCEKPTSSSETSIKNTTSNELSIPSSDISNQSSSSNSSSVRPVIVGVRLYHFCTFRPT